MNTKIDFFQFGGGLNLVAPRVTLPPGVCIAAQNYEPDINGGYRRIYGFERFDGHDAPSEQTYTVLPCTITGTIVAGDTVTGATSAATGKVIYVAATSVVITRLTGTFTATENLEISATPVATMTGLPLDNGADTQVEHATYLNLAADEYRTSISTVPGSGKILGVWHYKDVVYAFRNNAGGTACDMYKSTASGWSKITLTKEVAFSNANTSVNDNDTLTQGGVTATIQRVVVESGTLLSGVNTGRLIITSVSGGNFTAGAATSTGGGALTLSGAETSITLAKDGDYEFVNYNFYGSTDTIRMYGCDGVNRAFEFDGTVFVPINTGMTTDKPTHIAAHNNHLFLSFRGSLQHSAIGEPYSWSVLLGAGELAVGDDITGVVVQTGGSTTPAMGVFTRSKVFMLYGTSSADWQLTQYAPDVGAVPRSMQNIEQAYFMDDKGIVNMSTTQAFGNFLRSVISQPIQPYINTHRGLVTASCVVKNSNEYRLFFSDGTGLVMAFSGEQFLGIMPLNFGTRVVRCACNGLTTLGQEVVFFGSDDGYIYQMERGSSFDGDPIESWIFAAFANQGGPRQRKRYLRSAINLSIEITASLRIGYDLNYADDSVQAGATTNFSEAGGGGFWDISSWESFVWDSPIISTLYLDTPGNGRNMGLQFYGNTDIDYPYTIQTVSIHFQPLRLER